MDGLEKIAQLVKLLFGKDFVKKLACSLLLLVALLALPLELPELRAYCNRYMHWLQLAFIFCAGCLIVEFAQVVIAKRNTCRKRRIEQQRKIQARQAAVNRAKSILDAPRSYEYEILTALYKEGELRSNPYDPFIKSLVADGVIVQTSGAVIRVDGSAIASFDLAAHVRLALEEMKL